ncbi:S-adenosyl-L-methionine-dependentmethyltransferases superfamily protein [Striga asiatica]|uniref:S-adenosyl-L-methionine-dependentmethyltransferases superfamily protein n=1 Tax=Striga asiatica TaxID=4170 RepID=A0A5A7PLD9_STRAF|nr:S-adenosyl-L-methionine-dependentmethyltransferases superfamily protein [Striga asiatica]
MFPSRRPTSSFVVHVRRSSHAIIYVRRFSINMEWRSRPTGVQSLPASPTGTDARRWSRLTGFQNPSRRQRRATHSIVTPAVDRMEHLVGDPDMSGRPWQSPTAKDFGGC